MATRADNVPSEPGVPCEGDGDDGYFSLGSDHAICAAHRRFPEFRPVAGGRFPGRLQPKVIHSQS
jgi:hypothetical protein